MFNRSTKSVVQGNMLENAIRHGSLKELPEPEAQEQKRPPRLRKRSLLWGGGVLALLLILGGVLLLLRQQTENSAGDAVPEGALLLAVPVETSLGGLASPGDVIRLYAGSDPIPSLRYVQVWSAAADSVTILVDSAQLEDYIQAEGALLPVLMVHQDPETAEELLRLQQAWNSPEISLEVPEALELAAGETRQLDITATAEPQGAVMPQITCVSTDESVVTVSEAGTLTAAGAGQAEITVQCGDQQRVCTVTVLQTAREMSFASGEISIGVGGNAALTPTVSPEDCTEVLKWTSSDEAVAVVDETGSVTGVSEGEAEITVSGKDASASYTVTVAVEATDIHLNRKSLTLEIGGTGPLAAVVEPEDASDKAVTWESSDESVAVVDAEGVVTALAEGEAEITASCGAVLASCSVTVTAPARPDATDT